MEENNIKEIDEDMVLNLIDTEVDEVKRDANEDYIETIERMQSIMNHLETNKEEMENHINKLEKEFDSKEQKLEKTLETNKQLQLQYKDALAQSDMNKSKNIELCLELNLLKKKLSQANDKIIKEKKLLTDKLEKQERELSLRIESLEEEKQQLSNHSKKVLNEKLSLYDLQNLKDQQLNDISDKYNQLMITNSKTEKDLKELIKIKDRLENDIYVLNNKVEEQKKEYDYQIEKINMEQDNKIKELNEEIRYFQKAKVTNLDKNMGNGLNLTDSTFTSGNMSKSDDSLRNIMNGIGVEDQNEYNIENSAILSSNLNQYKNSTDKQLEQEAGYLKEIEQQTTEIVQLREQVVDLKRKLNKEENSLDEKEELDSLKLDNQHLKEQITVLKENSQKEKQHYEQHSAYIEGELINVKLKLQGMISDKDKRILLLMKKLKHANIKIGIYEEEIKKFNKYIQKRKR